VELLAIYARAHALPAYEALHNAACDSTDLLFEDVKKVVPDATTLRSDDRRFQKALLAYRTRARPCVFLDTDSGTCRIYEMRPIPCRMHFSVTDPQLCWPGHPKARKARTPNLPPPDSIVTTMKEVARRAGLEHLSPVLFQGLIQLGKDVLDMQPLPEAAPRTQLRRRKRDGS
jgi:Fe-S-cluster containining protein